jgi:uncharacterized membrane protein
MRACRYSTPYLRDLESENISEAAKKLGRNLSLTNNKNGYVISVALALLIASILLAAYFVTMRPPSNATMTIYLLDSQKKASDYPELLTIDQNNTFYVWVYVENHMGNSQDFKVLLKLFNDSVFPSYPINVEPNATYSGNLGNGKTWETMANLTISEAGNYTAAFELWVYDKTAAAFLFSNEYAVLPVQVIA